MLNTVIAFALGFSGALFLVLLAAPAIARRISDLTWRQAERVLPQSLEEIAAQRDTLRGAFAVETRKLEMAHEALNERHNANRIALVAAEDRIAALAAALEAERAAHAAAAAKAAESDAALAAMTEAHDGERTRNADQAIRIESFTAELKRLTQNLTGLEIAIERARTDAIAEQARLSRMTEARDALRARVEEAEKAQRAAKADLRAAETAARQATRRSETLEARLAKLTAELADAEMRGAQRQAAAKAVAKPDAKAEAASRRAPRAAAANDGARVPPAQAAGIATGIATGNAAAADADDEIARQLAMFRRVLPQAATDGNARKRLAQPMFDIAAIAVADALRAADDGSPLAARAADERLGDSPLGQAIRRRVRKPRD